MTNLPDRIADPQLGRLSAAHVYDLIALAIGATNDGREIAQQRGVRAARLEAIKADLIQNVTLDLERITKRQGISSRYIQMLFEESGTTFSEFVLERRLDVARTMLTSPRYQTWSVTAIALEAGFGDISHFNRSFRRRYLMTPSDMRAHARTADCRNRGCKCGLPHDKQLLDSDASDAASDPSRTSCAIGTEVDPS